MSQRVVILGGGTAGTLLANRLDRMMGDALTISVVDRDDVHVYQPGLLFVPFGAATARRISRSRSAQLRRGIVFVQAQVDQVDVDARQVALTDGRHLPYDVLVVATGATLAPEETAGLTGPGWQRNLHTFYTLEGAAALAAALATIEHGRLVVDIVDMPIKCPVAPLEFTFLADAYLRRRGIRDRVEITLATPLDSAFTKPVAAQALGYLLESKDIGLVTQFNVGEVDADAGQLVGYDERTVAFDLAVVVPAHVGAAYVGRSPGLGDALGFVPVDPHTLQAKVSPEVFAIGDATDLPSSKAGSVAHFQGHTVAANVVRHLAGEPLLAGFDGHANCFVETGFGKALLVDFNYDVEPVPGHYPGPIGLPLLRESRLNHAAKLMFEQFYWRLLLPGLDVPGLTATMPTSGKQLAAAVRLEEE